jgi:transposase
MEKTARTQLNRPERPPAEQWKIPRAQWPSVLERIEQGESLSSVGRSYGVSRKAVRRTIDALRAEQGASLPLTPGRRKKIPPSAWPDILQRSEQESCVQIARSYGVSAKSIQRALQQARHQTQTSRVPKYAHQKIPQTEWPTIQQRRRRGESLQQIATTYGVSKQTIRDIEHRLRQAMHDEADAHEEPAKGRADADRQA